jgi:hypothetical protein
VAVKNSRRFFTPYIHSIFLKKKYTLGVNLKNVLYRGLSYIKE